MNDEKKKWYDNKWIIHILLIIFFPVGLYGLWKSNTIKKWWKVTATILIGLIVLGNLPGDEDKSSNKSSSTKSESPKQWVEVYEFTGSGMKKSGNFTLTGNDARLSYDYVGNEAAGIGMFAVYVVKKGVDIMRDGGIPDIMITSVKERSESYVHKSAGEYYLNVSAQGNWAIVVEEER